MDRNRCRSVPLSGQVQRDVSCSQRILIKGAMPHSCADFLPRRKMSLRWSEVSEDPGKVPYADLDVVSLAESGSRVQFTALEEDSADGRATRSAVGFPRFVHQK